MRRTAQIANPKVVKRIPFPCFSANGIMSERVTVRPHIQRWAAHGIRIKEGVEQLWVRFRVAIARSFECC